MSEQRKGGVSARPASFEPGRPAAELAAESRVEPTSSPFPPGEPAAIRVTAMPADTNVYGDIFGGWLVGQMDLAAGAVASRHAQGRAVTAAIDAITFHHPVRVGDEVSVFAACR